MNTARIAVSIDETLVRRLDTLVKKRVFRTRSEAIENAVREKLGRTKPSRLARACAGLSIAEEQAMAEEGMTGDVRQWPEY